MKSVGKHFPGHGFVKADSHLDLPIDNRTISEINKDLYVFAKSVEKLDGIMPAHVLYPQVDNMPAGFSKIWIQNILRTKLGFEGVIFSDDLSMIGAHSIGDIKTRVQTSIMAGCDMVLICNHPELVDEIIDTDWGMSQNAHLMQGKIQAQFDKIQYQQQLDNIKELL
jgi:beta-N-acetylhexosaminidase